MSSLGVLFVKTRSENNTLLVAVQPPEERILVAPRVEGARALNVFVPRAGAEGVAHCPVELNFFIVQLNSD